MNSQTHPGRPDLALESHPTEFLDALEASGTGLWIWDVGNGEVTWTRACYALYGVPMGAAYGYEDWVAQLHTQDRERVLAQVGDALRVSGVFASDFRIVRRTDGVVRWMSSHGQLVPAKDGTRAQMRGSIRDVTEQKLTEARLRETQDMVELALEASALGFWGWDLATGAIEWSPRVYEILGLREGDFPMQAEQVFTRIVHPEDLDRVRNSMMPAIEACLPYAVEFRVLRPDGGIAWVVNRGRAESDAQGRAVRVVGTLGDVTEIKDAEVALQAALSASRTGTFRWDMRTDALTWDIELDRLFGLEPGRTARSLEQFISLVHPDDRVRVIDACGRCRSDGADFEQEFRVVWPDGTVHWLYDRGLSYRDPSGAPAWMTGACVDITQRKQIEHALQESEERFRVAVEAVGDIVWTNDASGRMVGPQPSWAAYTGQSPQEYAGYGWARAVHPEDAQPSVESWRAAVEAQSKYVFEHRVRRRDGVWRTFAIRALPVRDVQGRVKEWVGVHTDVTDLRQAQETIERQNRELREADARKDVFLATLSHELRNPLAPIRTAAEVMRQPEATPRQSRWAQEVIDRQARQMGRLLDDLLDVSRITQGKLLLKRERVSLDAIVQVAVETVQPLLTRKRHALDIQLPTEPLELEADPVRLGQVIGNLLTNAAKYTDDGGQLRLEASCAGPWVTLRVIDDGIGLDAQALSTVFDMFTQVEPTGRRSEGGLGVGLALVRGLVALHGGTVEAHSEGWGRGCTFTVRVPALAEPLASIPSADVAPANGVPGTRRVLVVDDNRDAADSLGTFLELTGHCVRVAYDGREALAVAEGYRPEVVVLDIGMPDMDGYTLARLLRAEAWAKDLSIIALTGWGQREHRDRSTAAGIAHHLTKPIAPLEIDQLLRSR